MKKVIIRFLVISFILTGFVACDFNALWNFLWNLNQYREQVLNVPFLPSEGNYGMCGAACIQMWSRYHGYYHDQYVIDNFMGGGGYHTIYEIANAVCNFTDSKNAIVENRSATGPNANVNQDELISYTMASIGDGEPVIVAAYTNHVILAIGVRWYAERKDAMIVHEPSNPINGDKYYISISDYKSRVFLGVPSNASNQYGIVISNIRRARRNGGTTYYEWLARGGTFTGGPQNYDPHHYNPHGIQI